VFRMFSKMAGQKLAVESDHAVPLAAILKDGVRGRPDVTALASLDKSRLALLVWHYHDDDVPGPPAEVDLMVTGLPAQAGAAHLEHFRIDEDHSNAFTAWKRLGSPQEPTPEQYAQLQQAAQLAVLTDPARAPIEGGAVKLRFQLPRQAVSLLLLDWAAP
jgi:xylan 1,4-beta-xylosidase